MRRDQAHSDLKYFHGNKKDPSSPSYFCTCVFEVIPCTAKLPSSIVCWKDLDELFDYTIFPLSTLYNWKKKMKTLDSKHQQNAFPKLKSHIKLSYRKTTLLKEHF